MSSGALVIDIVID